MPARNYDRIFTSASGLVKVQAVNIDSTPLHNRYLYSGHSGGGYATGASGADRVPNSPNNIAINPGVTAANGYSGSLYNASNFQCVCPNGTMASILMISSHVLSSTCTVAS